MHDNRTSDLLYVYSDHSWIDKLVILSIVLLLIIAYRCDYVKVSATHATKSELNLNLSQSKSEIEIPILSSSTKLENEFREAVIKLQNTPEDIYSQYDLLLAIEYL